MAIDAKVSFMAQAEKRLASELTAETMGKVLSTLSEVLDGFEMRETAFGDDAGDDLLECYLAALKVQGRSQKSIDRYRFVIGRMMKAVKVPTRRITVYHLRQYLDGEKGTLRQMRTGAVEIKMGRSVKLIGCMDFLRWSCDIFVL